MAATGRPQKPVRGAGPAADFAQQLRRLREHAGLTLRQLAAITQLSTATLSVAESGRRLPSWKVCQAFVQGCRGDLDDWSQRWQDAGRLSQITAVLQYTQGAQLTVRPTRRGGVQVIAGPPPLPITAETTNEFMDCLLRVKIWAGDPPVRDLARMMAMPASTIQGFLRCKHGKLPALEIVTSFLNACGVEDPSVTAEWIYAWRRLKFAETTSRRRGRRGHLRSA
jgi:transcriptional regulator with XRE-family HTH domain